MKLRMMLVSFFLGLLFLPTISAQNTDQDIRNHPGYVDFSTLTSIAGNEPIVEISLKSPLLKMITNILKNNDEQAADFISTLLRVSVRVFDTSVADTNQMAQTMSQIADDLDAQSWERVMRVRDDGDHVDVYFRLSESADMIHGIAIMVAEPNETVMVNIVGDISPDDISAIGERFDIDELNNLNGNN